jgi:hypothetical protein
MRPHQQAGVERSAPPRMSARWFGVELLEEFPRTKEP